MITWLRSTLSTDTMALFSFLVTTTATLGGFIWAAWKLVFHRPRIRIEPSQWCQIALLAEGPALIIEGTLLAENGDCHVYSMKAFVARADEEFTTFNWFAFLSRKALTGQSARYEMYLATTFVVRPGQPHHFIILFLRPSDADPVPSVVRQLKREWDSWFRAQTPPEASLNFLSQLPGDQRRQWFREQRLKAFTLFEREQAYDEAHDALQDYLFWQGGELQLEIESRTLERRKPYFIRGTVSMDNHAIEAIRERIYDVLDEECLPIGDPESWPFETVTCVWRSNAGRPLPRNDQHLRAKDDARGMD